MRNNKVDYADGQMVFNIVKSVRGGMILFQLKGA